MSDLRKAAEMALEALEKLRFANAPFLDEATKALRQALAQPEQEPVGYVTNSGTSAYLLKGVNLDDDTPLYAEPTLKKIPTAYLDAVDRRIVCLAPPRKTWLSEREDKEWRKFHADNQYNIPLYEKEQA